MKEIVIIGAGGLGREVLYLIERDYSSEYKIIGFADDFVEKGTKVIGDFSVVYNIKELEQLDYHYALIIAIANPNSRKEIYNTLAKKSNYIFPSLIAKTALTSKYNTIEDGCIIFDYSILTVNVRLYPFVIVNNNCTIGHEATIYRFVTLYPSVNISGSTFLEEEVEIGTGSQVIQNITIGKSTIIGAGAVVTRNIPSNSTAVGVPAKVIKVR